MTEKLRVFPINEKETLDLTRPYFIGNYNHGDQTVAITGYVTSLDGYKYFDAIESRLRGNKFSFASTVAFESKEALEKRIEQYIHDCNFKDKINELINE